MIVEPRAGLGDWEVTLKSSDKMVRFAELQIEEGELLDSRSIL